MDVVRRARLLLVDDHPVFRRGLATVVSSEIDLEVAGQAASGAEAVEVVKKTELDLVTLDMLMPQGCGITTVAEILEVQPNCKILALSAIDEPGVIADMLIAGAHGYALKAQPVEEILGAVRDVLGGIRYLPPSIPADAIEKEMKTTSPRPFDRLTAREREVFELLIRGFSNDEVAARLFIARRTAETHRQRITKKLSAHSVVQMQRMAVRYGGLGR